MNTLLPDPRTRRTSALAMLLVAGGLAAALPARANPVEAPATGGETAAKAVIPCVKAKTRGLAPCVKSKTGLIVPCVKTRNKTGAIAPCVKTKLPAAAPVGP